MTSQDTSGSLFFMWVFVHSIGKKRGEDRTNDQNVSDASESGLSWHWHNERTTYDDSKFFWDVNPYLMCWWYSIFHRKNCHTTYSVYNTLKQSLSTILFSSVLLFSRWIFRELTSDWIVISMRIWICGSTWHVNTNALMSDLPADLALLV